MQSKQHEYTDDLKYVDNQGHFIIFQWKSESKICHLWSNLIIFIALICFCLFSEASLLEAGQQKALLSGEEADGDEAAAAAASITQQQTEPPKKESSSEGILMLQVSYKDLTVSCDQNSN